jgi:hypothetical protein
MARLRRLALARSAGGNHIRAVVRNELKALKSDLPNRKQIDSIIAMLETLKADATADRGA